MQIGLATAKDSSACLFTVSDQPWLTAETIINLVDKFRDEQKGMACTIFGTKTRKSMYLLTGILSGTDGNYRQIKAENRS